MATLSSLFFLISLIASGHELSTAYTEEENLTFISKILDLLNNNDECQLPTYEEIDELQASFVELELTYGTSFLNRLNDDQKLVRDTVLDQWESFQKRMTSAVVIRSAKKRSFLCKIEGYQTAKYGFSVCTKIKGASGPVTDRIFEKNPLVRYIKHCETHAVCDSVEDHTKTEVIHTPITDQQLEELQTVETKKVEEDDQGAEVNFDPLIDIPIPTVENLLENKNNNTDVDRISDLPDLEGIKIEHPLDNIKEKNTDEHIAPITEAVEITAEVAPVLIEPVETNFHGFEYVEDYTDEQDLNRLNHVDHAEGDFDWNYGYFSWPDESPDNRYTSNDSIKIQWVDLLKKPFLFTELVQNDIQASPEIPQPLLQPEIKKGNLKNRKKEYFRSLQNEAKARQQDELFGWNNRPDPLPKPDRWVFVADNNLCKITYNRDYIGKMRGVVAVKALFRNGGQSKKRSLMS